MPKARNQFHIVGDKAVIVVRYKGEKFETVIDAYHMPKVSQYRWNIRFNRSGGNMYVVGTRSVSVNGVNLREEILLHRLVMGSPSNGFVIDHINGNGLNNTDANLRIVTVAQNAQNRTGESRSSTGIRNVYKVANGRYMVQIGYQGKQHYFGTYETIHEASQTASYHRKRLHTFADPAARNVLAEVSA
jgi:hypothetical protein